MRVHFIAIGGAAMHNLAIALKNKNFTVSGSDDVINDPSRSRLKNHGLLPSEDGWNVERISEELDAVILGMHAKADNPELLKAKELGLKIFSYPEFIYNQSVNKNRVVIGGSHGKYLTSPIDLRPKFHLYKPDLALISGIAWDHINVFPTYEIYLEQFRIFIDSISENGALIYNAEDIDLNNIVSQSKSRVKKIPYTTPAYFVKDNVTYLQVNNEKIPLKIFGKHNINNLMGAKFICQEMGISQESFFNAICSFDGASNRLELISKNSNSIAYKDFAHSPSKVKATTDAVKSQNSKKKIVACLELHTFSSLNIDFIKHYKNSLDSADEAVIFYSQKAIELKKMQNLNSNEVVKAFNHDNLIVVSSKEELITYLRSLEYSNLALLMMSSGKFGGLNFSLISDLFN